MEQELSILAYNNGNQITVSIYSVLTIILAFISFLFSVFLWFSGDKLAGIFVGIWVPSILALSISIRQRNQNKY